MSSQILSKPLPYIALILAHLIWGANFVVAKVTLEEFPPASLAFLRFSLATLLLIPFFFTQTTHPSFGGKKVKINRKDIPKLVAIGILMITLNIAFFFEGITKTTAINASVLTLIIPILSVVLGWIFLKEKIYLVNLLGIFVGLLGAVVIIQLPEIVLGNYSAKEVVGNILILFASVCWVLGAVISRQMLKIYPSLIVTAIAFMVGTVTFLLPAANEYLNDPLWMENISILGVFGLFYMTLLSSVSAYFLFEWGLSKTSVIKANLFQYIEPFIAVALAITLLGEKITIPFLVGAALITAGVYLGTLAKELYHRQHKTHRF